MLSRTMVLRKPAVRLLLILLTVSCAGPPPSGPPRSARAARLGVATDSQANALCDKVRAHEQDEDSLSLHLADAIRAVEILERPFSERITVDFVFADAGTVYDVEVVDAARPAVAEAVEAASLRARPFPRLSPPMRACFAGRKMRATLVVDARFRCGGREDVAGFMSGVIDKVSREFDLDTFVVSEGGATGTEQGAAHFRLVFDADGRVDSVWIVSTPNGRVQRELVEAVQRANPFGPPPQHARCFAETPQDFRLSVIELNRPRP